MIPSLLQATNNPNGGTWYVTTTNEWKEAAKLSASIPITTIVLISATYEVPDSIVYPHYPASKMLYTIGNGATVSFLGSAKNGITRERPVSADDAEKNMQSCRISFSGLNLIDRGNTETAINTLCTYQSSVIDCKAQYFKIAFKNEFGLQTKYDLCEAINSDSIGFLNTFIDTYGGTTGAAKRSNNTWYYNCRVVAKTGSYAGFSNYGNSGSNYLNCVVEGGNPIYNIYLNSANSSVVNNFNIGQGTHFENSAKYGLYAAIRQGNIDIADMYAQYTMILIKVESSAGYPTLSWNNCGWWPSGTTLETDANTSWYVTNAPGGIDMTDSKYWVNGRLPVSYVFGKFGGTPVSPKRSYNLQSNGYYINGIKQ